MITNIIVNKQIYKNYKDDFISLNPRLFTESYFYNLENYEVPLDLKGIENYLHYNEKIDIYTSTTYIDFINVLLVLSFLKNNNFDKQVIIHYCKLNDKSLSKSNFLNVTLTLRDFSYVDLLLTEIKKGKIITKDLINLPGSQNFISFHNMINDSDKFILLLQEVIDEYEENIDDIANYLCEKYSNLDLSKEYFVDFLKKYL